MRPLEEAPAEGHGIWFVAVLLVLCGAAGAALLSFPRFAPEPAAPAGGAGEAGSPATTAPAEQLELLDAECRRLRREVSALRKDHEALAAWTLQSLLGLQAGGRGPLLPPPARTEASDDVPLAPRLFEPTAALSPARNAWVEAEVKGVTARLQLFPQQFDRVEPVVRDYVDRLRDAVARHGQAPPEALADERQRLRAELRGRLEGLLTDEQLSRFDELAERPASEGAPPGQVTTGR